MSITAVARDQFGRPVVGDTIWFTANLPAPIGPTRDPALWPFATDSPWNRPIGANAQYETVNVFGPGLNFGNLPGAPNNFFFFNTGSPPFGSNQPFGQYVVIGRDASQDGGAVTDPVTNLVSLTNTVYPGTTFPRHIPTSMPFNGLTQGEWIMCYVTPDHLTSMQMYDPSYSASGSSGAGFYAGSLGFFNDVVMNIDTKGPGFWSGDWSNLATGGDIAIALNRGDEATPYPSANPPNGSPIGNSSVTPNGTGTQLGATGISYLGGLVRSGELLKGIPHALAFAAGVSVTSNSNAPGGHGMVWPAGFGGGGASNSSLIYWGALIAIPQSVNLAAHTFNTTEGKNIGYCLQNYGMYVVDGSGANVGNLYIDLFHQDEVPSGAGFGADLVYVTSVCGVVKNSFNPLTGGPPRSPGIKIDQGDGTLLAPLAPPFGSMWGGGNGRAA